MRKMSLLLTALLLLVSMMPASVTAQDEDPIVIGWVIDESGIGAIFAESQIVGVELAIEDLNANGGILGREVTVIRRDAQLDPAQGATIAREFILEDEVDFLLGPTSSSVALAVSEVAAEFEIPLALHTSNSIALTTTNFNPYIVQVVPNTDIEARAVAQFAAELGYGDWASISPDYSFGRDSFGAFSERLADASDVEFVTEQWPALSERNLGPFITAIQARSPEAVYSSLWGEQAVTFVLQALDYDLFFETEFIGLFDTDFMKAIGDELPEDLLGYARAPFYGIDTPEMENFVERYLEKSGGTYPSDWGIMAYDAVMVLAAAAEEAGTIDGPAVAAAFDDLTFMSLRGELTIRACDHMANAGEYIGFTTQDTDFGFPGLRDVTYVPAEDVWDSCEDIEAMREE